MHVMSLPDRVLRTVRAYRMLPAGRRVLVAVSGGSDSVALALLLRELEDRGELELAGLAHLNHRLREAADSDEDFCRKLAAQLGVPFHVERFGVRDFALEHRRSIEDAARFVRYEFFRRILDETATDAVATGHTRDDQAETFLLRLLRGAGTRGLAAILPAAGRTLRPLIDIRRDELRQYLVDRGQVFCEDETNRDTSIPRNRVRHDLIPYLEREFSRGIIDILAREAELARQDEERLQNEAIDSVGLIVLRNSSGATVLLTPSQIKLSFDRANGDSAIAAVEIDAAGLATLHPAVASRIARIALSFLAADRFVGFDHVEALLDLAKASSGAVSLPGQTALRRGTRLELVREAFRGFATSFSLPLSIPGEVSLDAQGWAVSAQMESNPPVRDAAGRDPAPVLSTGVQADRLALPLRVRSRRPGDRFQPLGLGGREKKLQDFLVDRKVPKEQRDLLPLVVDSDDKIVWIVGYPVAEDFRVTEPSLGVILLKARRLGGQG
jgi:tRNA(Ile)-lysidine synthase